MRVGPAATPDTIVLIHGSWLTPRSWERWTKRFASRGYRVLALPWPGIEAEVEALNVDPSSIMGLTTDAVISHYERLVRSLTTPPIIMGHGFGGACTQILLDHGLGAAGVSIASAPGAGVRGLRPSVIRPTASALNPFTADRAIPLSPTRFHHVFANTLSRQESDAIFRRYHVPASGTLLRQSTFPRPGHNTHTQRKSGRAGRAPLLFIAFGQDHLVPPSATRRTMRQHDTTHRITAYRQFAGRPHFPAAPGWEAVADFALTWTMEQASL